MLLESFFLFSLKSVSANSDVRKCYFDEEIMRSFELSLTHDVRESNLYQLPGLEDVKRGKWIRFFNVI